MPLDIDSLKNKWKEVDISVGPPPSLSGGGSRSLLERLRKVERATSAKDKLLNMHYLQILVCVWGLLLVKVLADEFAVPVYTIGLEIAYFITGGIFNLILIRKLRSVNYSDMSVTEILDRLIRFASLRGRFKAFMIAFAIPVLILMILSFDMEANGEAVIYGSVFGLVIGVVCAVRINRRHKRLMTRLMEAVGSVDDAEES